MRAREYKALLSMKKWFTPAKVEELAQTSPFRKLGYINEWYGTAEKVVQDTDKILAEINVPDPNKVLDSVPEPNKVLHSDDHQTVE